MRTARIRVQPPTKQSGDGGLRTTDPLDDEKQPFSRRFSSRPRKRTRTREEKKRSPNAGGFRERSPPFPKKQHQISGRGGCCCGARPSPCSVQRDEDVEASRATAA
ncbi:hypothetical protein MRX96_024330 [Rhipicephalus microplus]